MDVLRELSALHEAIKEGCYTALGELRVGHADQGIEFAIEDMILVDHHAEGPLGNDKLVVHVVRAAHEDLVLNKVASQLATAKADSHPVLLLLLWLLVRG